MDKAASGRMRCSTHPAVAAVATCDGCGRRLCLDCSTPVRGEVLGLECLPTALPETPVIEQVTPPVTRRSLADRIALAGLAAAALATALPWAQFGVGSSAFGAWGFSPPRYASAVGPAAIVGLAVLWIASRPSAPSPEGARRALRAGLGGTVVLLCLLALIRPEPFASPNLVPYVALLGALATTLAAPLALLGRAGRADRAVA
ncbi:MAG: hypothetical protein WD770_03160 [Actinomycetota bacterium]